VAGDAGGEFAPRGGFHAIALKRFYVGIGVCQPRQRRGAKARCFECGVEAAEPAPPPSQQSFHALHTLEIITVASTDRRAIYVAPERLSAELGCGMEKNLRFQHGERRIEKDSARAGLRKSSIRYSLTVANNDQGISPDGHALVISDNSQGEEHPSRV